MDELNIVYIRKVTHIPYCLKVLSGDVVSRYLVGLDH